MLAVYVIDESAVGVTLIEHILQKTNEHARKSYVYWTVHHLDS
jgi:hypothetical protein